jgi:two-component system sensor histidine kinase ChiS
MKKPVIICVDDEQVMLNVLNAQLKRRFGGDFNIELAESAEEAMTIIDDLCEDGYTIQMIISDQIMPGVTGDRFLVNVHQKHPKPIKVLLTGQAGLDSAINSVNNADLYRYLTKPWAEEDFLLTIEKGLKQYSLTENLEKQIETFSKFVPKKFLESLEVKNFIHLDNTLPRQLLLSILFLDIRNFTKLSEQLSPSETFAFLNEIFQRIAPCIEEHHGFIDKFLGDGIMALFDGSVDNSLDSAIKMHGRLHEFNLERVKVGQEPIRMGIGINSGELMLGMIGTPKRLDSTVVGDAVNIAARLETLTKYYQSCILISEDAYHNLNEPGRFKIREIDNIRLYGKENPMRIYEVYGGAIPEIIVKKDAQKETFLKGLTHYKGKNWDGAILEMQKSLDIFPEDRAAKLYIERCLYFKENPPSGEWSGVIQLEQK